MSNTFGNKAHLISANGYAVLPVHRGQKNPSCGLGWSAYRFRAADLKDYKDDGIGIMTKLTPGVDLDVREPALATQLYELAVSMLGAAPRRIGLAPKSLLLYRLEGEPFSKIQTQGYRLSTDAPEDKAHKVEVLADGQQFVAFNIHPDTGKPYTWNGTGNPITVPVAELPPITRERAQAFVEACEAILAAHGKPVGRLQAALSTQPHEPNEQQLAKDPAACRSALAAIPNDDVEWDDWVLMGLAVKGALGEDGADAFDEWSAKSSKYDPVMTGNAWKGFRPEKVGAGTVYHFAKQAGWYHPDDKSAPFSLDLVMNARSFLDLPLPELDPIIDGLLFRQHIVEIVGYRGCGKTWTGLDMARAIAEGSQFLCWNVPTARRVLYVDGEMSGRELQNRIKLLLGNERPALLEIMASELFHTHTDGTLNINDPSQQVRFEGLLKLMEAAGRRVDVLMFDNLSALTIGMEENSSSEFQALKAWFTRLRHIGITVLFFHHAGKDGKQRGTSGREDNLNLTIQLTEPEGDRTDTTRINFEIGKCRGERPKPDKLQIALVTDQAGVLRLAVSEAPKTGKQKDKIEQKYVVLKYIAQNNGKLKRKDIAEHFDVRKSTSDEHIQKLIVREHLISPEPGALTVTEKGAKLVNDLWPGEVEM